MSHFLTLSLPLTFDPVQADGSTSLFYDESNGHVFVLRKDGNIQVKGIGSSEIIRLKIPSKPSLGEVFSIKLSPDSSILALQKSLLRLDFFNIDNGQITAEYSQACRSRGSILGFCWITSDDIIVITDHGIELFQVFRRKKQLKVNKTYSTPISWFIFSSRSSILVTSSNSSSGLQFFQFSSGSMIKLNKLELGDEIVRKPLVERDACLCELYGQICFVLMVHEKLPSDTQGTRVVIYTLQKDTPPVKSHILLLELTGKFALSVLDNLVIIHHQTSLTSLVFDIKMPGEVSGEKGLIPHKSVVPPYSMEPVTLEDKPYEMYSCNWIFFQPNVIIDVNAGCLWKLSIDLNLISSMISSPALLVDFLLQRQNSQSNLIKICREAISGQLWSENGHLMGTISLLFNKFNQQLRRPGACVSDNFVTLDQTDMYSKVFNLFDSGNVPDEYGIAVVFEYINSLVLNQVSILYSTYELLINLIVKSNRFYQLQQFIQYHVFTDSKPLACLLLSLHHKNEICLQLALDMFKRLNMTRQDLIDVYLSVNSPSSTSRAIRSLQIAEASEIPAGKFLEAALSTSDDKLLFSIYRLVQAKMPKTKSSEEELKPFITHLQKVFMCGPDQINSM